MSDILWILMWTDKALFDTCAIGVSDRADIKWTYSQHIQQPNLCFEYAINVFQCLSHTALTESGYEINMRFVGKIWLECYIFSVGKLWQKFSLQEQKILKECPCIWVDFWPNFACTVRVRFWKQNFWPHIWSFSDRVPPLTAYLGYDLESMCVAKSSWKLMKDDHLKPYVPYNDFLG